MSFRCSYQDCLCVKYPCGSSAFFSLPNDHRRHTWIRNSGNKSLLALNAKATRYFCENHFRKCDIRVQFNRKLLRKHAVPIPHPASSECVETQETELQETGKNPIDVDVEDSAQQVEDKAQQEEDTVFVIEKFVDNTEDAADSYGAEKTPLAGHQSNESATGDDSSFALLDFYLTDDLQSEVAEAPKVPEQYEEPEETEEPTSQEDELGNDNVTVYYEETSNNQVDSSTFEATSDEIADPPENEILIEEPVSKKRKRLDSKSARLEKATTNSPQVTTTINDYEEDKHFALSLVGYFQRLPKGKKALAKLKILQYLTELEMGVTTANI